MNFDWIKPINRQWNEIHSVSSTDSIRLCKSNEGSDGIPSLTDDNAALAWTAGADYLCDN